MRVLNELLDNVVTVALSNNSSAAKLDHIGMADVMSVVTSANPSNKTFVDANVTPASDTVAITAHGMLTGAKVTLTTTGTLPAGLATATNYYIIKVDADTIKFATSQANALAGTAVDITAAAGGGTHTVNVTTTLAGTIKLQKSDDPDTESNPTWYDVTSSSQTISAAATFNWELSNIGYRQLRVVTTITSGTVTVASRINGKGF